MLDRSNLELHKLGTETRYTNIPSSFVESYNDWFDISKTMSKYEGDLLKACEAHPIYHIYYLLGFKPRLYQAYHLDQMTKKRFIMTLMGRRMGKSLDFKGFANWALWWNKYPQGREKTTKVLVIAHTADSSDSYIEEVKDMYIRGDKRVEQLFKGKLGSNYFSSRFPKKNGTTGKNNTTRLSIYNNGWNTIESYPPTTRARGRAASIIFMDEVAFWCDYTPDDFKIYADVVRPIITDTPDTRIFGATTPNGASGLAYELLPIDAHDTRFDLIWYPCWYREDQDYKNEMIETYIEYSQQGRENSFRQEYLAELVTKQGGYFDAETEIPKVFNESYQPINYYAGKCHLGLDFGGSVKSRTVVTISVNDDGKYRRLYHKAYQVGQDSTLKEDLIEIDRRFPNIVKRHIDNQGGGSAFYAWFRNKYGSSNIDEVQFRTEKQDMYRLFKIACYQDKVKSYYDPEFKHEFLNFTGDLKPSKNSTDDMLDSFVMSIKDWLPEKTRIKFERVRL